MTKNEEILLLLVTWFSILATVQESTKELSETRRPAVQVIGSSTREASSSQEVQVIEDRVDSMEDSLPAVQVNETAVLIGKCF